MVKVVYHGNQRDGHPSGYVELSIDAASDLTGLTISTPSGSVAPAAGSIAYTSGMAELYQVNAQGVWIKLE